MKIKKNNPLIDENFKIWIRFPPVSRTEIRAEKLENSRWERATESGRKERGEEFRANSSSPVRGLSFVAHPSPQSVRIGSRLRPDRPQTRHKISPCARARQHHILPLPPRGGWGTEKGEGEEGKRGKNREDRGPVRRPVQNHPSPPCATSVSPLKKRKKKKREEKRREEPFLLPPPPPPSSSPRPPTIIGEIGNQ